MIGKAATDADAAAGIFDVAVAMIGGRSGDPIIMDENVRYAVHPPLSGAAAMRSTRTDISGRTGL